jgi:hypothetical protein
MVTVSSDKQFMPATSSPLLRIMNICQLRLPMDERNKNIYDVLTLSPPVHASSIYRTELSKAQLQSAVLLLSPPADSLVDGSPLLKDKPRTLYREKMEAGMFSV